jgi:glycosyltransferase involved in cell wall biosynthesis
VAALALGHGRPVVATAVGGLPAAIDHGADGLLAPPDDPSALARAIEALARDHVRLRQGAERIRSERSFDAYAELIVAAATRGKPT